MIGNLCAHDTWALAKPVIAGPGDTGVHTPETVTVNGLQSRDRKLRGPWLDSVAAPPAP